MLLRLVASKEGVVMSGSWWRVKPPIDSEFLVLVVGGRVAVSHGNRGASIFRIGDRWSEVRKKLEDHQFVCTMVSE